MAWIMHHEVGADRSVHVWPDRDERPHRTEEGDLGSCWCFPEVETYENGNSRIVHNDQLDRLGLDFEVGEAR